MDSFFFVVVLFCLYSCKPDSCVVNNYIVFSSCGIRAKHNVHTFTAHTRNDAHQTRGFKEYGTK